VEKICGGGQSYNISFHSPPLWSFFLVYLLFRGQRSGICDFFGVLCALCVASAVSRKKKPRKDKTFRGFLYTFPRFLGLSSAVDFCKIAVLLH